MEQPKVFPAERRVPAPRRRASSRAHAAPAWKPPPIRSSRKIPLPYVVLGVTVYCAMAWTAAIIGVNAGVHALQQKPESYASSHIQKSQ